MFQVRIHGRGGQGVVTGAELLSMAAFLDGYWAQAFPSFGSERMGAPVTSYCRIDDHEIRTHEPISEPDALIIQDATLLHQVDLFSGTGKETYILINTSRDIDQLGLSDLIAGFRLERILTVPASDIARRHIGKPVPNAVLLGALAAGSGIITLESLHGAIRRRFSGDTGERNVAATAELFSYVQAMSKAAIPSMGSTTHGQFAYLQDEGSVVADA
ncbi:MAG: 2-oxoacid:acceptor oxidoreductase family protein [Acidimicrobiales bacterium]